MPALAARAFSFRWRSSGTWRSWIIVDMLLTYKHVIHMSITERDLYHACWVCGRRRPAHLCPQPSSDHRACERSPARARHDAEFSGASHHPGDACAPDLVLAGQAVDVRTGAADPAAFDYSRFLTGLRQAPSKVFAALAATDDNHVVSLGLRHRRLQLSTSSSALTTLGAQGRFWPSTSAYAAGRIYLSTTGQARIIPIRLSPGACSTRRKRRG